MVDDADGGGTLFSLLPTAETREEDEGCVVLDDCSVRIYHEFATPYGYYPLLETGGVSERGRDIAGCYLAFAGPERGLAVAITTSKLASEPVATRKVLKLVLAEYGLGAAAAELV